MTPKAREQVRETTTLTPDLVEGRAALPTVCVIVLANDMVSEVELQRFVGPSPVGLYVSRIPADPSGTTDALAAMEAEVERGARCLLPAERVDAMVFSCTSGTAVIGSERVEAAVRRVHPWTQVVTPLTASVKALSTLGALRIGLLTPYRVDVHERMVDYYREAGFVVDRHATFNCQDESSARRLSVRALVEGARHVADANVDAVFVSCTAVECASAIPVIEAAISRPVVTSNQASAWQVLGRVGTLPGSGIGRLMSLPAPG